MRLRKLTVCIIAALAAVVALCITAFADDTGRICELIDDADLFSGSETEDLCGRMQSTAEKTGLNIIIMTTDDVGSSKSDAAVVDMCDVKYEDICGMNTDGVLFLINLDTRYHYLSTSGSAINYFSDYRIDKLYDYITSDMRSGNYYGVAKTFLRTTESYFDNGKVNEQQEVLGSEVDMRAFRKALIKYLLITGFISVIAGFIIFAAISSKMKLQRPSARQYILKNSLKFNVKQDNYIGTFTERRYSPRSSSSGSSSHRSSGHSSTHHSSHGGRHGGGGRHI